MEYRGGSYGYPPYEDEPSAGGANPADPRSYRADPAAYGNDPSPYGRDGDRYAPADAGYGYAPKRDASYGDTGSYTGRTARAYAGEDGGYAADRPGADYGEASGYTTRRSGAGYDEGGYTGRTQRPGYEEQAYGARGATGRSQRPAYEDSAYETRGSGRTYYPRGAERADPERDYIERAAQQPRRSKKKRSKFARFMRALGMYLAQLPAKTLIIFGGSAAMVLVAVVLLAMLLPNASRTERPDDGQIALTDPTPTPSLAPTNTPGPTEAPTPTVDPDPLQGKKITLNMFDPVVAEVQKRLVELGYMTEPDGGYTEKFGPTTRTAFRLFQMKNFENSRDWDGILGSTSYNLLMSDQAKAYYLARGDGDENTRVITKLVEDVTELQNRLITLGYLPAGSATGQYGSATVTAVQKFQEYHGLSPLDGIAGQTTLKLIYSAEAMDATTGKANNRTKAAKASTSPSTSTSPDAVTTPNP